MGDRRDRGRLLLGHPFYPKGRQQSDLVDAARGDADFPHERDASVFDVMGQRWSALRSLVERDVSKRPTFYTQRRLRDLQWRQRLRARVLCRNNLAHAEAYCTLHSATLCLLSGIRDQRF
jgi:hypothetical protein